MKQKAASRAFTALAVLAFALILANCKISPGDSEFLTGMVRITGIPQEDELLSVDISKTGGSGNYSYSWKRRDIPVASGPFYRIQSGDVGSPITVSVRRIGSLGSLKASTENIVGKDYLAGGISIKGIAKVGETLTVDTSHIFGGSGNYLYSWVAERSTVLSTAPAFVIPAHMVGRYIEVYVKDAAKPNSKDYLSTLSNVIAEENAQTRTVSFSSNGGSPVSSITVVQNTPLMRMPPPPSKTGDFCKFLGWYLGNSEWMQTNSVAADITLTAHWDSYKIGETRPGGGMIFYHDPGGFTLYLTADDETGVTAYYLEAAPLSDNEKRKLAWAAANNINNTIPTGKAIGMGRRNTARILKKDVAAPAAGFCYTYVASGTRGEWFLPNIAEIKKLHAFGTVLGYDPVDYWSSEQLSDYFSNALTFNFQFNGFIADRYKDGAYNVHPIRAF